MTTPTHIAIIMDGNRRWASRRGLPLVEGYRHGIQAFKRAIPAVISRKIPVATFWGFSTENWHRSSRELDVLFGLFRRALDEAAEWFARHQARFTVSGRLEGFPEGLRRNAERLIAETRTNAAGTINLALSYGGREEIQRVAKAVAAESAG